MSQQATTSTEKVDVKGGHLVEKVKELVHEGNVRRIVIKDSGGRTVMEVPVTVGVVGFFVAPHQERRRTMESYRSVLDRYVEVYNAGDLDGVMDLYADDAVQLMPDGTFEGRSAIRDRLAKELDAFSDLAHRVVSYVEEGDAFADEWVFVGTHTGPLVLPDGTVVPATGKRVEMPGMELVKMRDGKIVVDNMYYDNLAVAAQLGLLPHDVPTTVSGGGRC